MNEMNEHLIFDVGMHTGRDTEFYLKKGFNVVAIEANPVLLKLARSKFKDYLENGRLVICDYAIADYEGEISFYINDSHDDWGTISTDFASRNEKIGTKNSIEKVKCQPFINVLNQYGAPYYIKIDIEGVDTLCLKDLLKFDRKPKYLSIEAGLGSFEETFVELSLLWNLGYRNFKIVNQRINDRTKCPNPAREGLFVDYKFDGMSSGLFGKELPGEWMDIEQTFSVYKKLIREQKYFGANGKMYNNKVLRKIYETLKGEKVGWYDFHVKLGD